MTSSEIDTLTDRLVSRIFTSDYHKSFKLRHLLRQVIQHIYIMCLKIHVQTDTHNTIQYIVDTMSVNFTEVKPLTIKRSLGGSGTYQGLQQMSTAQMQYTFGQSKEQNYEWKQWCRYIPTIVFYFRYTYCKRI